MVVGQLKEIVRFEVNYAIVLGAGYEDRYLELLTCRGYLKKLKGQRSNETGEIVNKESFELWIRYQAYIEANLNVGVKIVINGRDYTIETWERVDQKNFYYKFIINEKRG